MKKLTTLIACAFAVIYSAGVQAADKQEAYPALSVWGNASTEATAISYYNADADADAVNANGEVGTLACVKQNYVGNNACLAGCSQYMGSDWYCSDPSRIVWQCTYTEYQLWSNYTSTGGTEISNWRTAIGTGYFCAQSNPTGCPGFCN